MIEIILTLFLILIMVLVGTCIVQNATDTLIAARVDILEEEIDRLEEEIKELRKKILSEDKQYERINQASRRMVKR